MEVQEYRLLKGKFYRNLNYLVFTHMKKILKILINKGISL